MKLKKSLKANLENKRFIFFETGLAVALLITFFAFEWKVDVRFVDDFIPIEDFQAEEIVVPITTPKVKLPPPPKVITDFISIVDNNEAQDPDLEIIDVDVNEQTEYKIVDIEETAEGEYGDEIFVNAEFMPEFPGGQRALFKWLSRNVKYPVIAQENSIEGSVFIGFVVDKDGSITNVKVIKSVDPSLDKEAVRVVKAMPKWKPGRQRNKNVRVSYTVPIKFKINN